MKRVAFNALVMGPNIGGLGVYMQEIMDSLLQEQHNFEPVVYLPESWCTSHPEYLKHPFVKCISIRADNPILRILLDPVFWPNQLKKDAIDLYFSPMSYFPLGTNVPGIVTIHDLRSFNCPEYYPFLRYHYLQWIIRRSARNAKRIISVSQYTRDDILKYLKVDSSKVHVIHEGIHAEPWQIKHTDEEYNTLKKKYGLEKHFILSIGHLEPRKNYIRLIEAFSILKKEFSIDHDLVIVGQENWFFKEIYAKVVELNLNNSVHFTNFVEQKDIAPLYQLADVFVTVSTFEGFGFTPLESMAAGTPVVVSNCSSLPEVVGDAAILCDPYNVKDIANSINHLLSDESIQADYIAKGFEHIRRYPWRKCVNETMKVIEENV